MSPELATIPQASRLMKVIYEILALIAIYVILRHTRVLGARGQNGGNHGGWDPDS